MEQGVAVAVLLVVVGGFLAQWAAARLRFPALVLLLALGLLAGPALGLLDPSDAMGDALRPAIGLAVAIIVFEGGLGLDFRELRAAGEGVLRLTVFALPLNWLFGAAAAHYIAGIDWPAALLIGAILVVTGPTVILPLLRQANLDQRSASFLRWEAIVNDPVGAVLTVLILEALVSHMLAGPTGEAVGLAVRLGFGIVAGVGLGVGSAFLVRAAFQRDLVPEVLKTPMLLSLALGVYALANLVMHEAGLIGATVFGVALANLRVSGLAELRRFKEALVVLLVSTLFVVLAADLDRAVLARLSWPIIALTLAVLFLVRPAAILLATMRSGLTFPERLLAAWIGPRGIVAAAVAGVAGLRLAQAGYPGAELVQPTVFAVIAATIVAHGFTLGPLARRLGLATEATPGLAIVGASPWATDLAEKLAAIDVPVLLVDIYPGALDPARRRGIPTLQAEILSEQAERALAADPVGYLIAATPDEVYNALVCARLAPSLGRERVYQIAHTQGHLLDPRKGVQRDWRGKVLASRDLHFATLESRHDEGWRFRVIRDPKAAEAGLDAGIVVMAVRKDGRLDLASPDDKPLSVKSDDCLVVFAPPKAGAAAVPSRTA